ncbi:MAG: two-component system NarL family sensor kinase [Crocinitomix sp.]|jgi:two-component system NarL family sensor kinase
MEKWQDPETLALWFGIVIVFVLLLVTSIIILVRINYEKILERSKEEAETQIKHQRELLETNIQIQEKERDRIAADLHDSLIGKLTVIRLKSQMQVDKDEIDEMMGETISEARRITHDLSPPLIEHTSICEILKELIDPWKATYKITNRIDIRADFDLSPRTKIQLTRIFQEVLTNITKHAEATEITFQIRQTERLLALKLSDNGKGIDVDKMKHGLGLKSIESRVQYINGKYKVRSKPNHMTSFLFLIPH